MKENLTWIVSILDESGSMSDIKSDTIGSFNEFVEEQKKVDGEATFTLVKFNSNIKNVYEDVTIQNVEKLNESNYAPSQMTRLYDAIGHSIKKAKDKIKLLSEEEKPEKVIFVIITDGLENRSTDFDKKTVFEKISKREKKGWEFIYLGANQDSMAEGGKIGIASKKTATWTADGVGIRKAFMSASSYTKEYRGSKLGEMSADLNDLMKEQDKKNS